MTQNPRQLFILTHEFHPQRGGIATYTEEMALAATRRNFEVEVWAPRNDTEIPEKKWPFIVKRLNLKGTQDLSCLLTISKEIIENRRTLRNASVYLPEPGPISAMLYLQFIKSFNPENLYITFHGSEIINFHNSLRQRSPLRKLIERANRVSVVSSFTQKLLFERFPEAIKKTVLTPGALPSNFDSRSQSEQKVDEKVVILTVGRLHLRKGQNLVLDALNALPESLKSKAEYWIVGTGKESSYIKNLKDQVEKSDVTVKLLGQIDDSELKSIYRKADIFAMTSIDTKNSVEGFGLVYLEAGAYGLPVIANNTGGVSDAVAHEMTGLLISPGDQPALTKALARLISNPEERRQFGEHGRLWASKNSWGKNVDKLFAPDSYSK